MLGQPRGTAQTPISSMPEHIESDNREQRDDDEHYSRATPEHQVSTADGGQGHGEDDNETEVPSCSRASK